MDIDREHIVKMLSSEGKEMDLLFNRAAQIRREIVGNRVYLRGLIEYSNVCVKNCLYCGIRKDNRCVERYALNNEEVMAAARKAIDMGSVVLQGGENRSPEHISRIETLIKEITSLCGGRLGITLSLGEQSTDTLQKWFDAGAHRYLLRIESSSPSLFRRIHPCDEEHSFDSRVGTLRALKNIGYQVGTGVMIGLPGQSIESLADDILFMRQMDIDMCGMGPYVESANTPLTEKYKGEIPDPGYRFNLALKMIAALRITMPDINIAAATALESLSENGRTMAVKCGANVVMPNITPDSARLKYNLYDNKRSEVNLSIPGFEIVSGERGDSLHFKK